MTDLGSKNPLQLAHSEYQDTKIFGTKVGGGSLDFDVDLVEETFGSFIGFEEFLYWVGFKTRDKSYTLYEQEKLKSKEPPQTFVPRIWASWYPEWANCTGFLEPKSVN